MELLLGGLAVFTAAFLAGVVGFAYGLVALPLLILVGVPLDVVVPINLVIALVARILVLRLSWAHVSWPRAGRLVAGSVPGALIGVMAAAAAPEGHLRVAAGVVVLLAVGAIVVVQGRRPSVGPRGRRPPSAAVELGVGAAGGLLGSTTSLNGVPPALLMTVRRVPSREVVADLAVYFIFGNAVAIGLLEVAGRVAWGEVAPLAILWIPVALVATRLGVAAGPRLPQVAFRRLTLALVVVSAVVGLADGLTN